MVKTKKRDLMLVAMLVMSLVLGLGFLGVSFGGTLTANRQLLYADTGEQFTPGETPSSDWKDLDFQSDNLFMTLDGNNGNITDTSLDGEGTEENPYIISNAEDLALLSFVSRRGSQYTTFEGLHFKLGDNIDLSGQNWTPIGTTNQLRRFMGTLDGNDKTISGIYAYSTNTDYLGLFSSMENATIKNLTINNSYVNNMARNYAGILSAHAVNVTVDTVEVHGLLASHADGKPEVPTGRGSYKGGLFGIVYDSTITNAVNNAVVLGSARVGGIAGQAYNTVITKSANRGQVYAYTSYAGGIIGTADGETQIVLSNLENHGLVQAYASIAGGIVGSTNNANIRLKIVDSKNYGEVRGYNNDLQVYRNRIGGIIGYAHFIDLDEVENAVGSKVEGLSEIGGLIGRSDRTTNITESHNNSPITAHGHTVGGLVGYIGSITNISESNNNANITSNKYSYGYNGAGGLVGAWAGRESYIIDCENHGNITGSSVGGAIGYISGANITIDNFENNGSLTSSRRTANGANSHRGVGGVIGLASNAGSTINIHNSHNTEEAELKGSYVGGIIGNASAMGIILLDDVTNAYPISLTEQTLGEVYTGLSDTGLSDTEKTYNARPNAVGGLVGYSNARLTIQNSKNIAAVESSGNYVGGLVGRMLQAASFITKSHMTANVTGVSYVGGIAGQARGTFTNVRTYNDNAEAYPVITGTGDYIGGIIGLSYGTTFEEVVNNADVDGSTTVTESENDEGETVYTYNYSSYVGGLIGATNSGSTVRINNSENFGEVYGRIAVGGLIGRSVQTTEISRSNNHGCVFGEYYYVGGLVGHQNSGKLTITNSSNQADEITGNSNYIAGIGSMSLATGGILGSSTSTNAILEITKTQNYNVVAGQFVGGIAGYINISVLQNSTLLRVENYGDVISAVNPDLLPGDPNLNNYGGYAGGLVGASSANSGAVSIIDSVNYGNVTGRYVGGLVASMHTIDISNSKVGLKDGDEYQITTLTVNHFTDGDDASNTNERGVGGLVYQSRYFVRIYDSENNAEINLGDGRISVAGGLVGLSRNIIIRNSTNNSAIINDGDDGENSYFSDSNLTDFAGGLVAYANNYITFEITDSYSYGSVIFTYSKNPRNNVYVGGVVGRAIPTYRATANANGITVIKNVIVNAALQYQNTHRHNPESFVGGLAGEIRYAFDISNIIIDGEITGNNAAGGLIGRVIQSFNIRNGLPSSIKNVMVKGSVESTVRRRDNNSALGGLIGHIHYDGTAPNLTRSPKILQLNIINSYSTASIFASIEEGEEDARVQHLGGLIGRVEFRNHDAIIYAGYIQLIKISHSFYLDDAEKLNIIAREDRTRGEDNKTPYDIIDENKVTIASASTHNSITTADLTSQKTFQAWDLGGSGNELTFWVMSNFNGGAPFLSNMHQATIVFYTHTADDTIIEHQTLDTKVGSGISLNEFVVARPIREHYDFIGWSMNEDGSGTIYTDGSYLEVTTDSLTLYAVWQQERILIEISGRANLYQGDESVATSNFVTTNTNYFIEAELNEGDIFLGWEIYKDGSYITLTGTGDDSYTKKLLLGEVLDNAFVNAYSYINTSGRKTITFQALISGNIKPVVISPAADSVSALSGIRVNGQPYRNGSMFEVNTANEDDKIITISFTTNQHYTFEKFIITDRNGNDLNDIYSEEDGKHLFDISEAGDADVQIQLVFLINKYNISVKPVLFSSDYNDVDELQAAKVLISNADFPEQISVNDSYSFDGNYLSAENTNEYRFDKFIIKNNITGQFVPFNPNTALTSNFLNTFLNDDGNNDDRNLEILAVFIQRHLFNVSILADDENKGTGNFIVYQVNNGVRTPLALNEQGNFIDKNTNILVIIEPDSNSRITEINGIANESIEGTTINFRLTSDTDIKIALQLAYYTFKSQVIDNNNQIITVDADVDDDVSNVQIMTSARNLSAITDGTHVLDIQLKNEIENHQFRAWYINVNGDLIPIANAGLITDDERDAIAAFTVTEQFLEKYSVDGEVTFVAMYYQLYQITIESNAPQKGGMKIYKVVDGEDELLFQSSGAEINFDDILTYGTRIKIVATLNNNNYYNFDGFSGAMQSDEVNSNIVEFTVSTHRLITLNFQSIQIQYKKITDTANAKGSLDFSSDTLAVGQTLTITFETDSGYEVRNWQFVDKNGVAHNVEALKNITYSGTNTLTLTIDEYWLETFGFDLQTKIETMMNSTFFMVVLIGGIAIPILLAGVIIFIILNNKKKAQALAAAKHSAANKFGLNQQEFLKSLVEDDKKDKKDKDKQ